ncbi:exopolysaccharide biosynthesis WecB/TagA/CpsF family protein [Palleronia aestuarii]|uniref:Exopolysaccharide biosynthesis WecB/TagA/CpsF family protein n=1 Tax=Palleronia aestuarii TaxID=568105 RepID=A0A2W7PVA4_9RHOB|nr:WecB/TagA/CpsF family glycosyltransferase [Palleronia aestuarii]PZX13449.1 exopolysaccharide biosynthesis WecB/TagA/CpsF family protein [Palleronia aestuarii]
MTDLVSFSGTSPGTVRVTHADRDPFLDEIEARMRAGQGFTIATLNLDHVVKIAHDPAFRAAYLAQSHVVADGNPIVWLSRLAGREVELIPGSELIHPLCERAARTNTKVALLGSTEETLATAADRLAAAHPGLEVVARIAPAQGFDPDGAAAKEALEAVGASGAGLCLLALGAPKQERLAARAGPLLPRCGFVSIGAGLDFIAGTQTRAPDWVRAMAAEWLWRAAGNPRRLAARYLACLAILPRLGRIAWTERRRG